ncbi:phosphoglycerate mutase [Ligilactobacillus acidipiscis DSM 15836]|uniref:Phosphoglycerate mutase n=3 Tax=Ligilactobacillus acidipiscis TaxID=89059 RepID=A0ABR5PH94_9LACO|nr:phosphoglycerate mutase [Ligilactobacillus acidipiscis DSM 15836]
MAVKYSMDDTKNFTKQADPFHNAEDAQEYWKRVDAGFDYIKSIAHDGDNILLVSHGTTIRSIAARFDKNVDQTVGPKNGSITKLVMNGNDVQVAYFNQTDDEFKY